MAANTRPEQPRWTSSRVARLREQQEQNRPPQRQRTPLLPSTASHSTAGAGTDRSSSSSRWAAQPSPSSSSSSSSSSPSPSSSSLTRQLQSGGLRPRDPMRELGGKLDRLALLASPSRGQDSASTALGNTDLTDAGVQSEFREYISRQMAGIPLPLAALTSQAYLPGGSVACAQLDDVALLVRKLREGCVAAGRMDWFVVEVYELSVYLAILGATGGSGQLLPLLRRLVLDLYPVIEEATGTPSMAADLGSLGSLAPVGRSGMASLLRLAALWSGGPGELLALRDGADVVSERAYLAVRRSDPIELRALLSTSVDVWQRILLRRLVPRLREQTWKVLRKAYLHVPMPSDGEGEGEGDRDWDADDETQPWLSRMLLLSTDLLPSEGAGDTDARRLERFLDSQPGFGSSDRAQRVIQVGSAGGRGLKLR